MSARVVGVENSKKNPHKQKRTKMPMDWKVWKSKSFYFCITEIEAIFPRVCLFKGFCLRYSMQDYSKNLKIVTS